MVFTSVFCAISLMIVWSSVTGRISVAGIDPLSELDCTRKLYTFQVSNTDVNGRVCSDEIQVMSCWGRCDSNEVSDWRFPYKRSHHPVCIHGGRELTQFVLRDCDDGAEPGTELYVFPQATSCKCHACKSSEASCEGYRYRDFQFMSANDVI
ncbi:thyrostimulin beta-5 subunit [Sipha flava]|uniref:Glycoprotein hormone beta-5 n=1 Tax=Sipha flava TaxID=143950 RepID=A0A2S2QF11_9HEMI|nr:thyrostimulin beta-5 subunit [Sipha flava]